MNLCSFFVEVIGGYVHVYLLLEIKFCVFAHAAAEGLIVVRAFGSEGVKDQACGGFHLWDFHDGETTVATSQMGVLVDDTVNLHRHMTIKEFGQMLHGLVCIGIPVIEIALQELAHDVADAVEQGISVLYLAGFVTTTGGGHLIDLLEEEVVLGNVLLQIVGHGFDEALIVIVATAELLYLIPRYGLLAIRCLGYGDALEVLEKVEVMC